MSAPTGYLTLDQLHHAVAEGHVDTVIVAFTDMQGRLVGKRVSSRLFLDDIAEHGAEACNYLLAVDVEMNTVDGYAMSSWERGYGDMALIPDFTTLRMAPWLEASALVTADLRWLDGAPVEASPRRILQRQLERLAERGLTAFVGTELEFIVFDDFYRDAWGKGYRDLTPASDYNIDYALLASTRMEPLLRDIRNSMDGAGMYCEGVKGECNLGQQEIAFRYTDALGTCDNHSIYKNGAKEIADRHGKSLTFMAKFNEREGNSCHIHISLRSVDGRRGLQRPGGPARHVDAVPALPRRPARDDARAHPFWHPTSTRTSATSRARSRRPRSHGASTTARARLRVVGHGHGLRVENRVPGGDVNQYLAVAALIAAGLHGIDAELEPAELFVGNAYESDVARVPATLRESAELFAGSALAREAFGDEVVEHYLNNARVELAAFDAAVTDWERVRGFERL